MKTTYNTDPPIYFDWLKDQVDPFVNRGKHENFYSILHSIPYTPIMELDRNREFEGICLRDIFMRQYGEDDTPESIFIDTSCSTFEFLVALAIRMDYIYSPPTNNYTPDLFWEMMENINLGFSATIDDHYDADPKGFKNHIRNVIKKVLMRKYKPNGEGNLFPIYDSKVDQRNVEIWYQMNQYLIDKMEKDRHRE